MLFFMPFVTLPDYIVFELQFEWSLLFSEIIKRPYITVGFVALIILSTLTLTSTKNMQRKLGKNWQKLHNWVYLAALMIALHFIWSVKSNLTEPLIYWAILLLLLSFRKNKLQTYLKRKKARQPKVHAE
ncbi:ferric reductase-like transmembrane domain-containing protein [Paraglaciecola aquimarina]|uniref:Ferric reductase-like transmembrane domain-containing protein n=1 Tax=Paraglaciecola aquimarina TaxID=1235557 RepID=A0ABU3SZ57_9ALTE|nr:ferric reductase-like transmembrane domain-containing protein [Paraglaciecola aquimarina]MDU0355293.1 ferric reductase-like transmembrane domain-containing protein [Paraglaciecola aquimarina]